LGPEAPVSLFDEDGRAYFWLICTLTFVNLMKDSKGHASQGRIA